MRLRIVFTIIALFWIILLSRIYHLSVNSNEYYESIAEQNAVKTIYLPPVRGIIFDAKDRPMAINRLGFSILLKPHLNRKNGTLDSEIDEIVRYFPDLNATKLKKEYIKNDSPYNQEFISVVEFIDYDSFLPHFATLSLRENLKVNPTSKRHYPYDNLASHVIGYVGRANQKDMDNDPLTKLTNYIGRSGVERYYNSVLQGSEGSKRIKVNALNEEIEQINFNAPKSKDIKLSIDLELQKFVMDIFDKDAGSVVVMNVHDGAILAAGSFPEYNLNPFVSGISKDEWDKLIKDLDHPFTNKLVNGLYPPGSVVKMGMALAFLDNGMSKNDSFFCSSSYELGGRKFRCWNSYGHGNVNMNTAIRESCDDYFYKASQKIGIDAIAPILERIGFGVKTGVDLPNEFIGTLPSREWKMRKYGKAWFQGETLITSIGQGNFLVTPMQIARHTAMLATGLNVTPHFLKSIDSQDVKFEPKDDIFTDFEKAQLPAIRHAMYEVANHPRGTASRHFASSTIKVAAKTGTAQVVGISQADKKRIKEEDMAYLQRSHAWMTTYAPYDNPQYVVSMVIEHGGHGGSAAGPKIVEIYKKLIEMGYINLEQSAQKP
ncbi:penicillin-binding protein 2 [Campylobacter sp. RM13119]|uniref:penicillin-binding protein 2 n=1 Tax=Campylobacter TaxID=194 RepID=UPI0014736387|nr:MULTISPECIES: penicillin-binding protein 2 [unclassified Campylobacter]MBE3021506.1 penicillin-binding protein 2 [Campylobacter sp. 7477a]MBE3605729.1 penicillin-binding protein 2 [Campylobacter sp. RM13119]MBE3609804.1 penicillin-binding protein 2 [Campylobacter sp. RM12916]